MECQGCGGEYMPKRPPKGDDRFCSGACRQKEYRRRVKLRPVPPPEPEPLPYPVQIHFGRVVTQK